MTRCRPGMQHSSRRTSRAAAAAAAAATVRQRACLPCLGSSSWLLLLLVLLLEILQYQGAQSWAFGTLPSHHGGVVVRRNPTVDRRATRNLCRLPIVASPPHRAITTTTTTRLDATTHDNHKTSRKQRTEGVYARPSAAIERGSGFFIPGLKGPRVRLLFGGVVLLLTAVNHVLLPGGDDSAAVVGGDGDGLTESLAIGYSLLLLLQAAIEFSKANNPAGKIVTASNNTTASSSFDATTAAASLVQQWSSIPDTNATSNEDRERIAWAAASFIAMTAATHMYLLCTDRILYRLGPPKSERGGTTCSANEEMGVRAALETLRKSTSGRVSLPLSHPAVEALVMSSTTAKETDARCVVLQRINDDQCWMMTSNKLLAAFTKSDLKFLGQLAKYVSLES